ncbi:MAG: hypothetical protein DHS20C15_18820 [Planctomycetota bacterium]|nr:MAG: hypothetical protein DHS20C15_18820 [Planctomycetota bacterium]
MSSAAPSKVVPPCTREELNSFPSQLVKDEGPGAPQVTRFELPEGAVILKEWTPSGHFLLRWWAGQIMRREMQHYALLDGTPGIPRFRGAFDRNAFLIQWVDAQPLKRRLGKPLMETALDNLERVLAGLHQRRFAHLDLHQRLNTLVGADGEVWLIDLGQGLNCQRGPIRRLLFPLLARIDRRALDKFRARYVPHTIPEARRDRLVKRYGERKTDHFKHFHRWVRRLLSDDAD